MQKRVSLLLTALLLLATPLLPGCMGGETTPSGTTPAPVSITQLQSEIGTLRSQVSSNSGQVAGVNSRLAALEQSNADLQSLITTLTATVASLSDDITELQNGGSTSNESNGEVELTEITRWSVDLWVDTSPLGNVIKAYLDTRGRIEDEDDYIIYLHLENWNIKSIKSISGTMPLDPEEGDLWLDETTNKIKKCISVTVPGPEGWADATVNDIFSPITINGINLVFRPKSGDRVKVNTDKVYLDNYGAPFLDWDTDISERDDGTCRKISATTNVAFVLPVPYSYTIEGSPKGPVPYTTTLRLEFELYYA